MYQKRIGHGLYENTRLCSRLRLRRSQFRLSFASFLYQDERSGCVSINIRVLSCRSGFNIDKDTKALSIITLLISVIKQLLQ